MRTFIFGNKGQLGRELARTFQNNGPVQGADLPEMDIACGDTVSAAVDSFEPDLIINAAAYTDVEGAESNREAAFRANGLGARVISEAAAHHQIPVVYYSTDFVFSGDSSEPHVPDEPVAPLGVYAESKAAGEQSTRECNAKHFILRTAWLYGAGGNNFVEKIIRATDARPVVRVVQDEVGSPTHALDLADATRALCGTDAFGTYHAVNEGHCSRYEFACAIVELAGASVALEPCLSTEFPSQAPRPTCSILSNAKLERACGFVMRPWRDALRDYLQRREIAK
ncbi:MAG: dTDP-4-dehydrorhamnose reductase [bacterium]|nr:dTDP-4-dehydrorhamnose reductase [bacterium]